MAGLIILTCIVLVLTVATLLWPGARESDSRVMMGKGVICIALFYGLGLVWASYFVWRW